MPFFWDWIWEKLSGVSKTPTQPQSLDSPKVDDFFPDLVVRNGGTIPAKKSNTGAKSPRVRSDNPSKTGRKSTGAAIRAAAAKGKAKSKTVSKG